MEIDNDTDFGGDYKQGVTMKTGDVVWVVGRLLENHDSYWGLCGVFTEEFLAVEACINENYFTGPASLNEALPYEITDWKEAYYPTLQTRDREPLITVGELNED